MRPLGLSPRPTIAVPQQSGGRRHVAAPTTGATQCHTLSETASRLRDCLGKASTTGRSGTSGLPVRRLAGPACRETLRLLSFTALARLGLASCSGCLFFLSRMGKCHLGVGCGERPFSEQFCTPCGHVGRSIFEVAFSGENPCTSGTACGEFNSPSSGSLASPLLETPAISDPALRLRPRWGRSRAGRTKAQGRRLKP